MDVGVPNCEKGSGYHYHTLCLFIPCLGTWFRGNKMQSVHKPEGGIIC